MRNYCRIALLVITIQSYLNCEGTLSNQLICKECPHGSETQEPFYTLSLEVSRQKSIHDSLVSPASDKFSLKNQKLFIQGEMLVGDNKYYCETCAKGVDTLKRCCIKVVLEIDVLTLGDSTGHTYSPSETF